MLHDNSLYKFNIDIDIDNSKWRWWMWLLAAYRQTHSPGVWPAGLSNFWLHYYYYYKTAVDRRTARCWTVCSYGSAMWTNTSRAWKNVTSVTRCYTARPISCHVKSVAPAVNAFMPSAFTAGLTRATTPPVHSAGISSRCAVY